jgi:hypothetical protein
MSQLPIEIVTVLGSSGLFVLMCTGCALRLGVGGRWVMRRTTDTYQITAEPGITITALASGAPKT